MKKEILCITHKYPPAIGGMERQSFELIKSLGNYYHTHILAFEKGSKLKWFLNLKKSIKTILANNPNIALIHLNDGLLGTFCLWLQKYTDIPIVVTIHGLDITFPSRMFQKYIVKRISKYTAVIAVSTATRKECLERGFEAKSTFTVRNGVDHDIIRPPLDINFKNDFFDKHNLTKDNRLLITMGRPVKRKGFSWFINNVLPKLESSTKLLMIGPLNNNPTLYEKIFQSLPGGFGHNIQLMFGITSDAPAVLKSLKSNNQVIHLGKLPFEDLKQVLSLADLFVMPNIKVPGDAEGFGLVALESVMRGTPVLASNIEGITDAVIDQKNGFLTKSEDVDGWVEKINQILFQKNLSKFSVEAIEFTQENYSWEIMSQGYQSVFDRFIK